MRSRHNAPITNAMVKLVESCVKENLFVAKLDSVFGLAWHVYDEVPKCFHSKLQSYSIRIGWFSTVFQIYVESSSSR